MHDLARRRVSPAFASARNKPGSDKAPKPICPRRIIASRRWSIGRAPNRWEKSGRSIDYTTGRGDAQEPSAAKRAGLAATRSSSERSAFSCGGHAPPPHRDRRCKARKGDRRVGHEHNGLISFTTDEADVVCAERVVTNSFQNHRVTEGNRNLGT